MRRWLLGLLLLVPLMAGGDVVYKRGPGTGLSADEACNLYTQDVEICKSVSLIATSPQDLATIVSTATNPTHVHIPNSMTRTTAADPSAAANWDAFDLQLNATQVAVTLDAGTDIFTTGAAHGYVAGDGPFRLDADTAVPTGSTQVGEYYISTSNLASTTFQLVGRAVNGSDILDPALFSTTGTAVWIAPIPRILLTCAPGVELIWNHTGSQIVADSGFIVQLFAVNADDGTDSAPEGTRVNVVGCTIVEKLNGVEGAALSTAGTTIQGAHYRRDADATEFRHYYTFEDMSLRMYSQSASSAGMGHGPMNTSGTIRNANIFASIGVELKGDCTAPANCEDLWSYIYDSHVVADETNATARIIKMDETVNVYSRGNYYKQGTLNDNRTAGWFVSVGDTWENCGHYDLASTSCYATSPSTSNGASTFVRGFTFINPQPNGRLFLSGSGTAIDWQGRVESTPGTSIANEMWRITDITDTVDPPIIVIDIEADVALGTGALDTIDAAADISVSYIRLRYGAEQVVYRGDGVRVPTSPTNTTVLTRKVRDTTWNDRPGSLVLSSADMDTGDEGCAPLICVDIADNVGDGLDADTCVTDHPDADTYMPICLGLSPPVIPGISEQPR